MTRLPLYATLIVVGAAATLSACTGSATSQEKANVAQAQATAQESVTAAQSSLTASEKTSQDDLAAAKFKLASAQATAAHSVAIADCAELETADRVTCTNRADDKLTAADQKAAAVQVTRDSESPSDASAQQSRN